MLSGSNLPILIGASIATIGLLVIGAVSLAAFAVRSALKSADYDPHDKPYGEVIDPGGCAPPVIGSGKRGGL